MPQVQSNKEIRSISRVPEIRGKGQDQVVYGYAALFDVWLDEGYWREVIRKGAFKNAIAEGQNVRALLNHDANWVFATTASEPAMRVWEDDVGLAYEFNLAATHMDIYLADRLERKIIVGSSFAFSIRSAGAKYTLVENYDGLGSYRWDREVLDVNLYDVSPCTYPAYVDTTVALRSIDAERERRAQNQIRSEKMTRNRKEFPSG